ncbi:flagellar hook-length control protein FliK [Salinarimonas sp.]|uniref:flagellar hook-length control protein FliK n=1 Tax=Salinarimonas sp. TaxID=2766526 RepID=UPI0032D8E6B8
MIPADLTALVQSRGGERASAKGGDGAAQGGLGALFDAALDGLAGRADAQARRGGGRAASETPAAEGEAPQAKAPSRGSSDLRSLAAAFERSLPIRPGALALQGRAEPAQADGAPLDGPETADAAEANEATPTEGAESLLAALAGGEGRKATNDAAKAPRTAAAPQPVRAAAPLAGEIGDVAAHADPDADAPDAPAPRGRADAFLQSRADLALATKPEPSVGMALKATVVSQATHLPPALGAANLAAVVDAATSLLAEGEPASRASLAFSPDLAGTGAAAKAQPVKVLTVQLQPVSLGTVTIALRMTADGVAMEITAADAKAAAMLRQDEKLIVDAVRRSGLAGEVVAIHTADAPRASAQAQAGGDGAQAQGQAASDGQPRPGGENGRGRGPQPEFSLERRSDDDPQSAHGSRRGAGAADGGVYL